MADLRNAEYSAFEHAYATHQFPKARTEDRAHALESARYHIEVGDLAVAPARRLFEAGAASRQAEVDVLRADVRWLMGEILDGSTMATHIPDHLCDFDTKPDIGSCRFHEQWCEIASRVGLLDEWAEEDGLTVPYMGTGATAEEVFGPID
jgi:hypothetical protein